MAEVVKPYISVERLSMKTPFGVVYEDVSFHVEKGQVVSLFGSEGSGKTALLLTLAGRMKADSGEATVAGFELKKEYKKVRRISNLTIIERVNDVPTNSRVDDILAAELQVVGKRSGKAAVSEYLADWGLEHLSQTKFRKLDTFEARLFDIALACAGDPELLLVDDIQEGLTQHQSIRLMKGLRNIAAARGITVIVGVLEYDIARYADTVVVISASAERQRQAVIRERGAGMACPVCGSGNKVLLGGENPSAAYGNGGDRR